MRTSASGRYAFTYRRFGASEAIYFVSSSRGGVAYFTRPLHPGTTTGDDSEILVYDTTSRAVPMTVRGRHVIVSAPAPGGDRTVTEVFDISNDSSVTRVAAGETVPGAVWSAILPAAARAPIVTEGDIPAQGVSFTTGRALVYAPFAPGMKQLVYSYQLASDAFPLAFPMEHPTSVLELLVEEPRATVSGAKLRPVDPVNVQGRHFARYLAADLPGSAVVTVRTPSPDHPINAWYVAGLTIVIGGAMTGALARAVRRR